MCKNATVPIITILDYSELDIEVLDTGMETTESDDCKGCLERMEMLMVCWP